MNTEQNGHLCRACGHVGLDQVRASTIATDVSSKDFAITDSDYGVTAALYDCPACGLRQCPESTDVLKFYQALEDPQYEEGRAERYLQAQRLIKDVLKNLKRQDGQGLSLLDVGAGSGILLEAAEAAGFRAVGVEPSAWLAKVAQDRGLKAYEGVLPHPAVTGKYDVVMLIDVIEHVTEPKGLMALIADHLTPDGQAYIVTPDVSSFFARVMGLRWWHYRIAHISYFNRKTLALTAQRAGLEPRGFTRPGWYFSYAYLRERLLQYLPGWILPPAKGPLKGLVIPLNLRDSLLMVCGRS